MLRPDDPRAVRKPMSTAKLFRAVCLALSEALQRFGAPEEVLTVNGQQFTVRFARGGEVLIDKICTSRGVEEDL